MKAFIQKHILTIFLLVLLSIPLTLQTFQPGFFVGDDGEWMIIRSSAFHEALRDGQFPVRYLGRLNHEFGYPVATFLYPGYLYLTEPLVIAGFTFVDAIKIMFALTMVSSGFFTYLWLCKLFDKWSALIGALVYLYTPYHLVDMYSRGSLGELLALTTVPFILWNIERRSLFFSAIGVAGLILSHNIMAALFLPVIVCYAYFRDTEKVKKRILSTIVLILFGLGIASFFWIPALLELPYTVFNQTKISEWQQYFAPIARIGGLPLVLLLTTVLMLIFRKRFADKESLFRVTNHVGLLIFFLALGVVSVFFSSSLSAVLWHVLPVTFIQFPFRFLSLEIVSVAFLAAYLLSAIHHNAFRVIYGLVIVLALIINAYPYFRNIQPFDKGEGFYVTNQSTTTTRDEYMPVWVKEKPVQRVDKKVEIIQGNGEISNITISNKRIVFDVSLSSNAVIQINKLYWPGWTVSVDGMDELLDYENPKGVMTVTIPSGKHAVVLSFDETPLRLIADTVSIVSFLLLVFVVFVQNKPKKHK